MRRLWTQREVIEMAKLLGFKNFDRRALFYWQKHGIFPEPVAQLKNVLVLYDDDLIDVGLVDIARRVKQPISVTYEDVKWAKEKVLESNKAKNVTKFIKEVRNGK